MATLHARVFDKSSDYWNASDEYNRVFLYAQEQYFNDRLRAYGHVFLNEVYDALGFPRTTAGQLVGWWWNPETQTGINFGIEGPYEGAFTLAFEGQDLIVDRLPAH